MGILTGLKQIQQHEAQQEARRAERDKPRAKWFKIEDGQSVKVRFLQELDPDSENYSPEHGLGFLAIEHSSPQDFRRKALCTMDDEGRCFACEQARAAYNSGDKELGGKWKQKVRLYINALVDDGIEDPYVVVFSQGNGPKSVTPTLMEYATEGTITDRWFKIKRTGALLSDTSYLATSMKESKDTVSDILKEKGLELYDLMSVVREVPYDDQAAHYGGQQRQEQAVEPATSGGSVSDADEW